MPIQTSLGQIRTMAEDLSKISKIVPSPSETPPKPKSALKKRESFAPLPIQLDKNRVFQKSEHPEKTPEQTVETEKPLITSKKNLPTPPVLKPEIPEPLKTTSPPSYKPQLRKPQETKKVEELLPLEETKTETKKSAPTDSNVAESKQESQNKKTLEGHENTMADLEEEIFPKPISQEQKTPPSGLPVELSAPATPIHGEDPSPSEETPEQLLGTEKLSSAPEPDFLSSSEQQEPKLEEPKISLPPIPLQTGKSFGPPPASIPLTPEGGFAQHPKKLSKNIVLIIGALVVLGAVIAGGAAFLFFSSTGEITEEPPPQEEPTSEEPEIIPISPPSAIMIPDFIQELSVSDTLESTLRGAIKDIAENQYPQNSITYLPIRIATPEADGQFLTAQAFMDGLNITLPEEFFDIVRPTFMLYLYGSGDIERIACQNNLVSEKSCYGPGLGLIFEARDEKENELTALMEQWRSLASFQSNLDAFILTALAEIPEEIVFDSADYRSEVIINTPTVTIRYINLPMPFYDGMALSSTALDFAIVENKIVFSTSKKSMETAIDRLLQE